MLNKKDRNFSHLFYRIILRGVRKVYIGCVVMFQYVEQPKVRRCFEIQLSRFSQPRNMSTLQNLYGCLPSQGN